MTLSVDDFDAFHVAVHGHERHPFGWQDRLIRQIVKDKRWPEVLDLPTGSGKTTCIDIALFSLALDAQEMDSAKRWCPRRIAMVVDRRVVVDQAAERGHRLLQALLSQDATPVVLQVANLLNTLSHDPTAPLGVFTLRGGMPKDNSWARSPDQPLILASTVDQIGSRLLIQGYGVSGGMRPVHAGLLGNDTLLLLDEVHLSRPFAETLEQLGKLRQRFANGSSVPSRFQCSFLSATPGKTEVKPFILTDKEKDPASPLGLRLHAKKPVRIEQVEKRPALERACSDHARDLIERHGVVAVVVNRVASAQAITRALRESLNEQIDVALLTGRMRPLDRDDALRILRPRIATGRDRALPGKRLIVVGTQCIEAGADFDFDALVTEAASLDALRQRFGRVDRLGTYEKAEGVIIHDSDKEAKDDPIYADAASKTVGWLKKNLAKKGKTVDFGVLALPLPPLEEQAAYLAPREHAPVLLPAYLDLWMQTSPPPTVVPDVALFLHGPKSGPADVQVVWRVDLDEGDLRRAFHQTNSDRQQTLISIVGAVRPSSLEAMSLPFAAVRRWLGGKTTGDVVDVEGAAAAREEDPATEKLALCWDGDNSAVIGADSLRPGDTIILPATRGGIADGSFFQESTDPVADLAERAALLGRGQPLLRLHDKVLAGLNLAVSTTDAVEAREALKPLAQNEAPESWRHLWLKALAVSKSTIVVDADEPWTVLRGRRLLPADLRRLTQADHSAEDGMEFTTDEDESSYTGHSVKLADHSANVERLARGYATMLGLPPVMVKDIAIAGWLHDIGKADRRFQILLRGGSEIEYFKEETPWAKSGMPPGAKAAHRRAQKKSGYPKGTRHEVQSLAMLDSAPRALDERANDIDLVLHLIGSHHGYCRPFAPVATDENPVTVELQSHSSKTLGNLDVGPVSSGHDLYRLDSPLGDRFWGLVGKYGWHQLCWLESILRLADHRASEREQELGGAA
jgi:CRISPR-associated endonuclease/helicase Cas3